MHRKGHIGGALLVYAPVGGIVLKLGLVSFAIGGALVTVLLAMLPDYDQQFVGLTHRGPTHTVWFAVLVGIFLGIIGSLIARYLGSVTLVELGLFGFIIGFITIGSHIITDAITPAGVRPFAPYRTNHISYDIARADNMVANYILLGLGVIAAVVALVLGLQA